MTADTTEAFREKFNSWHVKEPSGCWAWQGALSCGYGRLWLGGHKYILAHRLSYKLHIGPLLDDEHIDHICRNRACVNPEHLRILSTRENVLCGEGPTAKNARKTHCKNGHQLSGSNLYITPEGGRKCRACRVASEHRNKHKYNYPRSQRAIKTHCPKGHPYDEVNTYITPKGKKDCRQCRNEATYRYRARKS